MRERLITLLCALGALGLFVGLFLQSDAQTGSARDIPRPTTAERRGNGYYGLATWLETEGLRVISLRERFSTLGRRSDLRQSGNLLIVTLPTTSSFKTEEFVPLDRWVRAGNTLLVLAALADAPDWAFLDRGLVPADVSLLTGVSFETVRARELRAKAAAAPGVRAAPGAPIGQQRAGRARVDLGTVLRPFLEPERLEMLPNRAHAYFRGVRTLAALSDYDHQDWALRLPYEGFALELAHERGSGAGALWTRPLGAGRIIVSACGSLFTNRALALGDNARLFANLVAVDVSAGGAVIFDDAHQGLAAAYDVQRFYRDPRLYATGAIACGLWLLWVIGATRLRAPEARSPAPRASELVRASGGFLARVVSSDLAARRMVDLFLARAAPARALAAPRSPWEYLERHPRIAPRELAQLQAYYAAAHAGRRVPLLALHNLILHLDRLLQK